MKLLARIVGIVLSVILLLFAVGMLWLHSSAPSYSGRVELDGLAETVEVWWDSAGVPHVWAESLDDLMYAQGWIHAHERLWQMELFRRVAEGRLAEFAGADAEGTDRFLRTLGMWQAAGEAVAAVDAETRRLLESYVAGVNARIETLRTLPPEFIIARLRPEPWTVQHAFAVERVMAFDLSLYGVSSAMSRAVRELGPERARHLYPYASPWGVTILEDGLPASELPAEELAGWREVAGTIVPEMPGQVAWLLEGLSATRASNSWVIGPRLSVSGMPILANDMHLGLRSPGIWYLMALHAPAFDVAGMTLPGVPFVIAGHSRAVAWGFTNATLDDMDFLAEREDPNDPTRYLAPGGSLPFEVTEETQRIRGSDPVTFQVRRTRNGPIISDTDPSHTGDPVAVRWVAHEPSTTYAGVLGFNRARNGEEFVAAAALFNNPHQNIVWADTAGRFGYVMAGRVPIRGDGRRPPVGVVPGWTGDWDWIGWLAFDEHPRLDDPERGYIATANNRQAAGPRGDRISMHHEEPFRALRVTQMLRGARGLDADALHRQQLDVVDLTAARFRARAVAAAESARRADAADALRRWDLEMRPGSHAAALYAVWLERLRGRLAESLYGRRGWMPWYTVFRVLDQDAIPWIEAPDSLASMQALAMREAETDVDGRTWGELHRILIRHELGGIAVLDRLLRLNVGPEPGAGGPFTVKVSHFRGPRFPAYVTAGVSQRHVVDMADIDGAGGFIIPTGQSGSPFSRHYRDHFERWRTGGLWLIPLGREAAQARVVSRTRLVGGRAE